MKEISTIGIDIAKSVFQVHGIDAAGEVVVRRQLKRRQVLQFFAAMKPSLIGMEACATAHHWARELTKLGHDVRLMPPRSMQGSAPAPVAHHGQIGQNQPPESTSRWREVGGNVTSKHRAWGAVAAPDAGIRAGWTAESPKTAWLTLIQIERIECPLLADCVEKSVR